MLNIIRYPTIVITILAFIATAISGCSSSRTSLPGEPSSTRERKDLYYFHSGDSALDYQACNRSRKALRGDYL